jgi:hypothetical protein
MNLTSKEFLAWNWISAGQYGAFEVDSRRRRQYAG